MRVIKRNERIEMPWKNGGGTTLEIDRVPARTDSYDWRLSQALITSDGPFSLFAGYDRWLIVWEGDGLKLGQESLSPLTPYRFSGNLPLTSVRLQSNVTDIGLIFKRDRVDADMRVCSGSQELSNATCYIIAKTKWTYAAAEIEPGDTLVLNVSTPLQIVLPPETLVVSIRPL